MGTEAVIDNFGDYLRGFGDWIEEDKEVFEQDGMTKAEATDCLTNDIEEYFDGIHSELVGKNGPVERLFIADTEGLDINYREVAEAFLKDYRKPAMSNSIKKGKNKSRRPSSASRRR